MGDKLLQRVPLPESRRLESGARGKGSMEMRASTLWLVAVVEEALEPAGAISVAVSTVSLPVAATWNIRRARVTTGQPVNVSGQGTHTIA